VAAAWHLTREQKAAVDFIVSGEGGVPSPERDEAAGLCLARLVLGGTEAFLRGSAVASERPMLLAP